MKIGSIAMYGKIEVPVGYLLCDGSAVSRATYAALFAVIGTAFGTGDGSTTFNLPNLLGKAVFGYNSGDSNFNSIGKTGGAKTVNLAHSHTMNTHSHSFSSGSTNAAPSFQNDGGSQTSAAAGGHTHPVTTATIGNQSDAGTNSQLSASQSVMNPFITLYPLIKT